ncbi:uncharacterized protein PV09_00755 [Verruconis gallopava]|uniref:Zn(2)-C6 fungal-type domain-containing protein n=1 Tax=Verruconis gallopava TaxID=253628 RepID=A0A0D2AQM1_9PEZI|nr:uncharacterized protein PV09_00755 [Verruconis gallopava]KIW08825.1 hypothetical protein PV09_00755 [Verruconis gallopava]
MRLSTACDQCKARKVKCDGLQPCSHCVRRKNPDCRYTRAAKRPRVESPGTPRPQSEGALQPRDLGRPLMLSSSPTAQARLNRPESINEEDETAVPRDSRLLRDAQGKLMFIGDCAPLSFLQTVRQLITTFVDADAFATQGHDALLEQTESMMQSLGVVVNSSQLPASLLQSTLSNFIAVTSGLLDVGNFEEISLRITNWINRTERQDDMLSAVNYLILAIGLQSRNEQLSSGYFHQALRIALINLTIDTSPLTVQAFLLVAVHMLRSCQPNGAFLYLGLAARASYSIGMHRAEINARFDEETQLQRERLYKSLKIFDLFVSMSLGRPPALYDIDCSVPYKVSNYRGMEHVDLLDDVIQILLVVETIVEEVYSRRKISLQLTRQISQRLKDWAASRMQRLSTLVASAGSPHSLPYAVGACQALSTYYYAVMLLSKPFLMYEAYKVLESSNKGHQISSGSTGRRALADGCVDAACGLVDMVCKLTQSNTIPHRMPLIVSWLFTSSLVLGVALTAGFGRIMERYLVGAISALEYFAKYDAQATQYSLIARSLLSIGMEYLQRQELNERLARGKASSELFGLPIESYKNSADDSNKRLVAAAPPIMTENVIGNDSIATSAFAVENWEDFDISALGDMIDSSQDLFGTLNMFPRSDAHIEFDC